MMSFIPDRKVLAGGIGGLIMWMLSMVLTRYGITLPPEVQTAVVGGVTVLLGYVVPPSTRDIVTRMNDRLVQIAAADPRIPVSAGTAPPSVQTSIVLPASQDTTPATGTLY